MRNNFPIPKPGYVLWAGALFIIIACFIAYMPAVKGGFVWDDDRYVTKNPLLTAPDGLSKIWFSTDLPSQYFPMVYTTFYIEHSLWQFNPMGYHIDNVILHIINSLLLWLILRKLAIPGAWFASAVFALHPVCVESVAWITERKNTLMLFFSMLSTFFWIKFVFSDKEKRKLIIYYALTLIFYVLSLYSKATACTLPAAFLLILWIKRSPITLKRLAQIAPFILTGIIIGLVVVWWEHTHQGTSLIKLDLGPAEKILIAGRALWFYFGKIFWPLNLMASYPRWDINPGDASQYIWPAAAVAVLICLLIWRERLGRGTVGAIIFFAVMLIPMLSFFNLFTFLYTFVADHYQYAACIGPIALVSAAGVKFTNRLNENNKYILYALGAVILVLLGVLSYRQSSTYKDSKALWEDTAAKNPKSWLAESELAGVYFREDNIEKARMYQDRAIEHASYIKTMFPNVYANLYSNRALLSVAQDKFDDAITDYRKSLEIYDNVALTHYRLGELLEKEGKIDEALVHFRRALEISQHKGANDFSKQIMQRIERVSQIKK